MQVATVINASINPTVQLPLLNDQPSGPSILDYITHIPIIIYDLLGPDLTLISIVIVITIAMVILFYKYRR